MMTRKEATWNTLWLAAILGAGVCVVWVFAAVNVLAFIHKWLPETPVVSEEMVICEDGRVVIQTFVDRKADVTPARTLDGKPLASF
ncbi:MAG: hypothetical protein ABFC77_12880, partial [Thermoguttaceae bacterium]